MNPPGNTSTEADISPHSSSPKSDSLVSPQNVRKRILFQYENAVKKSKQTRQVMRKEEHIAMDTNEKMSKYNYPQLGMTPIVDVDVMKSPYSVINKPNSMHKIVADKVNDTHFKNSANHINKGNVETLKTYNQMEMEKAIGNHKENETTPRKKSTDIFIKPTAAPRKSKIRITPLLGSHKMPKPNLLKVSSSLCNDTTNSINSTGRYDSDMDDDTQSVFDLQLMQKSKYTNTEVHPFATHKTSQSGDWRNSTSQGNQVIEWSVELSTPQKQRCVALRPAFSDCGSRRPVAQSPYSVKSVGRIRKRTLNDSGIHSPGPLVLSPDNSLYSESFGSVRSSSDESDDVETTRRDSDGEYLLGRGEGRKIFTLQPSCPACHSGYKSDDQLMNSRTYNIVMETEPGTCGYHRQVRRLERVYIHMRKKRSMMKQTGGRLLSKLPFARRSKRIKARRGTAAVYDFSSESELQLSPAQSEDKERQDVRSHTKTKRRRRVPYTDDEERTLIEGVAKMGKFWTQILLTYNFHPSRTAVDLKDKYKRMQALERQENDPKETTSCCGGRHFKPFSMCEERRLRRGIKQFGYNWKTILNSFTFSKGRTTDDLRNRWRCMHKNSSAGQ